MHVDLKSAAVGYVIAIAVRWAYLRFRAALDQLERDNRDHW